MAASPAECRPRCFEPTLLHTLVARHLGELRAESLDADEPGGGVSAFVVRELEAFLGRHDLRRGFARLRRVACRAEHLLAFSCKTRTACPSCSTRRMAQTAAFLVEHVLPAVPVRQWVLAPPFPLVPLLGARPEVLSAMHRIFVSTASRWVESQVPWRGRAPARTGAVTFIVGLEAQVAVGIDRRRAGSADARQLGGQRQQPRPFEREHLAHGLVGILHVRARQRDGVDEV